jgi:hypothetical protein
MAAMAVKRIREKQKPLMRSLVRTALSGSDYQPDAIPVGGQGLVCICHAQGFLSVSQAPRMHRQIGGPLVIVIQTEWTVGLPRARLPLNSAEILHSANALSVLYKLFFILTQDRINVNVKYKVKPEKRENESNENRNNQ